MVKQETNCLSIEEAIRVIGNLRHTHFDIIGATMREVYEKAYYCIGDFMYEYPPFSGDTSPYERCEELQIDLNKGALLIGGPGVGKKTLFDVMSIVFDNSPCKFITFNLSIIDLPYKRKIDRLLEDYGDMQEHLLINVGRLDELNELQISTLQDLVRYRANIYNSLHFKTHISFRMVESSYDPVNETKQGIIKLFGNDFYERLVTMNNEIIWEDKNLHKLSIYNQWHSKAEEVFSLLYKSKNINIGRI